MSTALVTGANRGLGRAAAEELAREGFAVIVAARRYAQAECVAREIGHGATAIQLVYRPGFVRGWQVARRRSSARSGGDGSSP